MPRYAHLQMARLPERLPRRKKPGFGSAPPRDVNAHGAKLQRELGDAIEAQLARRRPEFVDPSLILSVRMSAGLLEQAWEQLGPKVLSSDSDRTLVLFASQGDLDQLRARFAAYGNGPIGAKRNAPHASFVANIESINAVMPRDRIGRSLRSEGFVEPSDFLGDQQYVLDLELWDFGVPGLRTRRLDEIRSMIRALGGDEVCRYVGPSISMLRFRGSGMLVHQVLSVAEVASVDLPPKADSDTATLVELGLGNLPNLTPDVENAPHIGVIDSGISAHPLLRNIVTAQIGVPDTLGTADEWGHGTAVAGVAVFGDVREQLAAGALVRAARLCVAKVTNDRGDFDERELVPSQMRSAIQQLRQEHGCRIFVCALADRRRVYSGGKVGAWAATLDEVARELDVVIIVAAGNRSPREGGVVEEAVTGYPGYLLEPANRLLEPAGAVNVITVGSLSHGPGLDAELAEYVNVRPIAHQFEPSPFTRIGPGVGGAIKPDLVELGGTLVFDAATRRLRGGKELASAGVVTLHHRYLDRLLTAASGTSYAAPMVAHKAAKILTILPQASANLVRALLAGSAQVPKEAVERLAVEGSAATANICGYGRPDMERAGYSDDSRVVLYAEDSLQLDHFAVYHIPVPAEFQTHKGRRTVTITLTYDPPVRHTRNDYCGVGMTFRLVRGCAPDLVFEHYKWRAKTEAIPEIANKFNCKLQPGPQEREKGPVQRASVTFSRSVAEYGGDYYLVVRCESGWAEEEQQRFAVVVELAHEAEIKLYQQIQQRVRVRA
jgi:subtilisin family serine protease